MCIGVEAGRGEIRERGGVGAKESLGEGVGCGDGGGGEAGKDYGDLVGEEGAVEEEGAGRLIAQDGIRDGVEDGGDEVCEERVGVVLDIGFSMPSESWWMEGVYPVSAVEISDHCLIINLRPSN